MRSSKRRKSEEDAEQDRPRKKKKRKPPGLGTLPLVLGGVGVLVVLLIIVGVTILIRRPAENRRPHAPREESILTRSVRSTVGKPDCAVRLIGRNRGGNAPRGGPETPLAKDGVLVDPFAPNTGKSKTNKVADCAR